jgi:hypothetical protein
MADLTAQQSAVSLLSGMPGLTVDARTCERGSYVIVECAEATQAMSLYEMVMMSDSAAELIYTTTSPGGVQAVRARMTPLAENRPVSDGDLQDA